MYGKTVPFRDRHDAGLQLALALMYLKNERPVILALPRGGVPVGYEIAHELIAPLDVLLVRKIRAPMFPELGLGALVDGNPSQVVLNDDLIQRLNVSDSYLEEEKQFQIAEIERRRQLYCGDRLPLQIQGRTVIVVDDGIATGGTISAALRALAQAEVGKLVLAVPVAPREILDKLCTQVDDAVCLHTPSDFQAVGMYYQNFEQTSDEEVISLLNRQCVDLSYNASKKRPVHPLHKF